MLRVLRLRTLSVRVRTDAITADSVLANRLNLTAVRQTERDTGAVSCDEVNQL